MRAVYDKLQWLFDKQKVHTDNLSRSNVPKEKTKEIDPFQFGALVKNTPSNLKKSHPKHLEGHATEPAYKVRKSRHQPEVSLSGNSISAEEQLMELNEATSQAYLMQQTHKNLVDRLKQIYALTGR